MLRITLPHPDIYYGKTHAFLKDCESRYIILWGGRGSGKSTSAARKLIDDCLTLPYFKCIMTRKIFRDIEESCYETIKQEIHAGGLQDLFYFRRNPLTIVCKINGNKFISRGFDKPETTKSIKDPTHVWYEEASEIDFDDFTMTTASVRMSEAKLQEILTFNPYVREANPEEHWIYKMFFAGQNQRSFDRHVSMDHEDIGQISYDVTVRHSTYRDNITNLKPEYVAMLEGYKDFDRYKYHVDTLGLWGKREVKNRFATHFSEGKHVSSDALFRPGQWIYISMDFNIDPFGFILQHKWRDDDGFHCHVFDEAKISNGDIEAGIQWLMRKYGKYKHVFIITGDKMGDRRDFGRADKASYYSRIKQGMNLGRSQIETHNNPPHENSRQDINYMLYYFDDFIINPVTCPETIYDMNNVECDAYGKIIKADRRNVNQRSDYLDCIRYSCNDNFTQGWIKWHRKTKGILTA